MENIFNSSVFESFLNITIVITCFLLGYVFKNYTPIKNKYIPLLMLILGIVLNLFLTGFTITLDTFVVGGFSGLASTGVYEFIVNLFGLKENKKVQEKSSDEEYYHDDEDMKSE